MMITLRQTPSAESAIRSSAAFKGLCITCPVPAGIPQPQFTWRRAATADKMGGMLALTVNDAAVRLLGLHDGLLPGLAPRGYRPQAGGHPPTRDRPARAGSHLGRIGRRRRGRARRLLRPDRVGMLGQLFHLEDFISVDAVSAGDAPVITEAGITGPPAGVRGKAPMAENTACLAASPGALGDRAI
jgi:hypothetical protein